MKKLLLGILALVTAFSLVACGEKKESEENKPIEENTPVIEDTTAAEENTPVVEESGEEQVGVGNTDEGMVVLALEQLYMKNYEGVVEEVVPKNIKVYTEEEIKADPALSEYTFNEGDIAFSAEYELKIVEGYEDMNQFTAGTGVVDGQWIREKYNVGIVRNDPNGNNYMDAFGTAF